jgi:hypothetical protein
MTDPSDLLCRFPRGIVGVTASSLSCLAFARFDRNLGFRAVTCPLDRAQDTSLRFIRDQSQQLSIFLVRLLKRESPISHSARVTHGISTPTQHREFKHEAGNRSCQKVRPRNRSSEARNRNEVHPLTAALDCHILIAVAAINRAVRGDTHLFRSEHPVNRLLGYGHRLRFDRRLAPDHQTRNRSGPFPNAAFDALNNHVFDVPISHD